MSSRAIELEYQTTAELATQLQRSRSGNMDHTLKPDNIESVLKDFDRRKQQEFISDVSTRARDVASAINADTPITLLADIRQQMSELVASMRELGDVIRQQTEVSTKMYTEVSNQLAEQHRETLAYLDRLNNTCSSTHVGSGLQQTPILGSTDSMSTSNTPYYYRGDIINSPEKILGCIFYHMDSILAKYNIKIGQVDVSTMDITDWARIVRIVKKAESNSTSHRGKIALPKKDSHDMQRVLNIVASPTKGRATVCKAEHIRDLISLCPTVMGCVEEIRNRIIECPGLISQAKAKRLAAIRYPFATPDGQMNIEHSDPIIPGSNTILEKVKCLNVPQLEVYANEILKNGRKPLSAAMFASNTSRVTSK